MYSDAIVDVSTVRRCIWRTEEAETGAAALYDKPQSVRTCTVQGQQWTLNHHSDKINSLTACFYQVHPTRKMPAVVFLHDNAPLYTDSGRYCHNHPTVLTLHNHIITCLMLWEKACEDTILLIRRSYRMLCACSCRREKESNFCWVGIYILVQTWKKAVDNDGLHWKTTVPSAML